MRRNRLKKTVIALGIVSLFVGLVGCGEQVNARNGPGQEAVKVAAVGAQTVEGDITLSGIFDAVDKAVVTSQLPGKVKDIKVKEGSRVKKGDLLISLDPADLQAQLEQAQLGEQKSQFVVDQAKLAYDNAQADFTRNQQLLTAGVISQKQFEQITLQRDLAKSQYDTAVNVGLPSAQSAVNAVQLNIVKTAILSPMDGIVATRGVEMGDNVSPGTPLVSVVSTGDPVLIGNISESALSLLQVGQKAEVLADTIPGSKFTGEIGFISPVSVPTGQFFPLKLSVHDPNGQLKPGMTGSAKIHVQVKAAVAIPNSALFRRDGKNYVYVVKEGKAVKTPVKLSFQGDKESSITEGLAVGDSIVIQGTDDLLDGMKIPA
ncbi:MAG: efflux RND transporter periplasmic adaptor subunit [Desulfitobacteriaceae bacterium]